MPLAILNQEGRVVYLNFVLGTIKTANKSTWMSCVKVAIWKCTRRYHVTKNAFVLIFFLCALLIYNPDL